MIARREIAPGCGNSTQANECSISSQKESELRGRTYVASDFQRDVSRVEEANLSEFPCFGIALAELLELLW
jgi:hypothetical protein